MIVGWDATSAAPYTYQAFRWTSATGTVDLGNISGGAGSAAYSVSADGNSIVGQAGNAEGHAEAFRWTPDGGMIGLGTLSGEMQSIGFGISADGSTVVGEAFNAGDGQAFRWTQEQGMVALPSLPGALISTALSANADGTVVDGYATMSPNVDQAFRWTAQTGVTSLGTLPGATSGEAGGMSANGTLIVGTSGGHAFLWTLSGGMMDLKLILSMNGASGLNGWALTTANDISSNGRFIAGMGIDPAGHYEAWLATLPVFASGDVNLDGIVNSQDIALVSSNWLSSGVGVPGDANGDGIVNSQDIALMSSNRMAYATNGTPAVAVPEPRASSLALVCVLISSATLMPSRRQIASPPTC